MLYRKLSVLCFEFFQVVLSGEERTHARKVKLCQEKKMVESSKTSAMTKLIWCHTILHTATLHKTQCSIVMEI